MHLGLAASQRDARNLLPQRGLIPKPRVAQRTLGKLMCNDKSDAHHSDPSAPGSAGGPGAAGIQNTHSEENTSPGRAGG